MTRFQKLAALTLGTAILLVIVGVVVRATDSGLGCPDWPFCHGQLLPPIDDPKAWIEWVHRTIAAIIGFEILGLAVLAIRRPSRPAVAAVAVASRRSASSGSRRGSAARPSASGTAGSRSRRT